MFRMKMTNRVMSGIVSAIVFFSAAAFSVTAEENITVKLNGQTLSFDVQPQIINDRTMVPLRTIFEALGANVDWNESNRSITATKDDTTIKLAVDNNIMYVNDETVTLDSPACIVDGRTLVPLRAISEALDVSVSWYGDTRTVVMVSGVHYKDTMRLKEEIISKGEYDIESGKYTMSYQDDSYNNLLDRQRYIFVDLMADPDEEPIDITFDC